MTKIGRSWDPSRLEDRTPEPVTQERLDEIEATAAALYDQVNTLARELYELTLDLRTFAASKRRAEFR